jgi:predicted GH43/DUF377 family glycosyl hydrolase
VTSDSLATRRPGRLVPDPSRVIARLFVPGLAGTYEGRVSGVIDHILALDDLDVAETLDVVLARFGSRHRDLTQIFSNHAERVGNRLDPEAELSEERWLLLGATFTHEYAVDAAALCNPSAVAHPDQSAAPAGSLRFVMSVRQIGEGHRSSIGFRTGLLDGSGDVTIDEPGRFTTEGTTGTSPLAGDAFRRSARRVDDDTEATAWVLDGLESNFTIAELEARLTELEAQHDTRSNVIETVCRFRELAVRTYTTEFPASSDLSERVLYPTNALEANGIEDARFVRFVDDDGTVAHHATYTAYDGVAIAQQLLTTTDFLTFAVSPLLGAAAENKGMALFPRRIDGRFAALSRCDGANNAIAFSDNLLQWPTAIPLVSATAPWEAVQVGNCGSPIETAEGWLVLTHGVGPMRTYSIGAWLLDLDDPTTIIGRLDQPLLSPQLDEQDGYVPNVVYSCGSLCHDGILLIPFGVGDASIGFATVRLTDLLAAMVP